MRIATIILLSGFLLGLSPQEEIASLKVQVKSLERQLVIARAQADKAGGAILRMPNAPLEYWRNPDLFGEHVLLRQILSLRKPDEGPKAWLRRNRGFVGRGVTWGGVTHHDSRRGRELITHVTAGKLGILTLQVSRGDPTKGRRITGFKGGVVVVATGIIQSIDIQPTEIKDGQPVHGAIVVHVKGTLQEARTGDKR